MNQLHDHIITDAILRYPANISPWIYNICNKLSPVYFNHEFLSLLKLLAALDINPD